MGMKRFLSVFLALCMFVSMLAPVATCVEYKTSIRQNVLFDLLDGDLFDLNLFSDHISGDLKVDRIEDDEVVKIFIVMDRDSVLQTDSTAVYNADTQAVMDELAAGQAEVIAAIEETLLDGQQLDVNYSYTWLLNGIATQVPYGMLEQIRKITGVSQVLLQPRYEACQTITNPGSSAQTMTVSTGSMIGRDSVWADGYTGQGIKIAVIDTGLDVDHQNFQALPEDKLTADSADEATVSAVLEQLNASGRYSGLTSADVYYNTKVVFGFNYADNNLDITHDNDLMGDHGTHVAGIAAANKVDGSEVVGVAPDAQLYVMKVYGAEHGGYAEDIMAALEDALLLGADVINMSLGTNAGFTTSTDEVNAIYERVALTNSVLCVAAGNNYTSGYGNTWGTDANQTKYPDNAVIGEPGVYHNVLSVASVENWFIQRNYIAAGEQKLAFVETSASYELPSVMTLEGEYAVVAVPGFGEETDFESLDLTGKIALIQRGTISFAAKCENAAAAGAVACIVYNNIDGEFGMDLTDCTAGIPCVSVTMEDGRFLVNTLAENPDFVISFPKEPAALPSLTAYEVSAFSSWGVAPDLSLEPDITAPGGNIYSTITDGQYGLMSGTSMATPHMSGITALVMQYVKANYPDLDIPIREFVQNLMVSTAAPLIYDADSGLYYTPRQQGSGLADAFRAICAQVYLSVEGCDSPKAELGDDADKTGRYNFTYDVTNFGKTNAYFRLSTAVQTEDYMTVPGYEGLYFMSGTPLGLAAWTEEYSESMVLTHDVSGDGVTDSYDAYLVYLAAVGQSDSWSNASFRYDIDRNETVTADDVQDYLNALVGLEAEADLDDQVLQVQAGQTASVSVSIVLEQEDKEYLDTYYPNGGYVDGFTFLTALNDGGVDLSLAFLGFYGSWDDAPILDDGFYWDYVDGDEAVEEETPEDSEGERPDDGEENPDDGEETPDDGAADPNNNEEVPGDEEDNDDGVENPGETEDEDFDEKLEGDALDYGIVGNQYINVLWTQFYGLESYFYPGYNAYITEPFDTSHISISPNGDGFIDTIDDIYISMLRNARYMTFRYLDADTGEVYYDQTVEYVNKSTYGASYGQIIPAVYSWFEGEIMLYNFTDSNGQPLPNNTHLLLQVEAVGDYEGATPDMWEVPITVDLEAPELLNVVKTTDPDGKAWLELTFRDNLSVAAVALMNSNGKDIYYLEGVEDTEPDENGYQNYTVTYDITEATGKLMIVLSDYALNEAYYGLNLAGEGTSYGDLVAYQYNFTDETFGWISFGEGVECDEVQITLEELDIACAEYVNGFIFAQNEAGALYGFRYTDLLNDTFDLESAFIKQLEFVYNDMAYSYTDGELYGLSAYEYEGDYTTEINIINIHGFCYDDEGNVTRQPYEEIWAHGRGGLYGLCMAIDPEGTFYVLGTNQQDKTELWTSFEDARYGTRFKKLMSVDVTMDYRQSMTWNHNNGTLYWAQFNPTSIFTYDAALYAFDVAEKTYEAVGTLSGETVGLFAPLKPETVASNDIYLNVPVMDTTIVGTPVLREKVANMNLGGQLKLNYDLNPWYTDHTDVAWTSSDESVVTVDQNGVLKAVGLGTAIVTVSNIADPEKYDTCTVNVSALSLSIEGVVTAQGAGLGNASGTSMYKYDMLEGISSFGTSHGIALPEDFSDYGLQISTSVRGRGYIWACEYGNAGNIYKIDPATGVVVDAFSPVDGDMLFGMTYNESLDTFAGIMNMYLFVDLELSHEEEKKMLESYDEDLNQFTYHRINMLDYLIAAGGNYVTNEFGQGASSEIVMCGVTTIPEGYTYVDTGLDYLGQGTMGMDDVNYTSTQTLVILDNVGRLWYIDEICGMTKTANSWQTEYTADNGSKISFYNGYQRDGIIEMPNEDGTYNVFYIRTVEDTPLTAMFLEDAMPRITYHFSDIEFGGYTADGAPIFALSLYDYWNNGTTNELYMYTPEVTVYDEVTSQYQTIGEDRLFYLGTTGQNNIIASIHSFQLLGGLDD